MLPTDTDFRRLNGRRLRTSPYLVDVRWLIIFASTSVKTGLGLGPQLDLQRDPKMAGILNSTSKNYNNTSKLCNSLKFDR